MSSQTDIQNTHFSEDREQHEHNIGVEEHNCICPVVEDIHNVSLFSCIMNYDLSNNNHKMHNTAVYLFSCIMTYQIIIIRYIIQLSFCLLTLEDGT